MSLIYLYKTTGSLRLVSSGIFEKECRRRLFCTTYSIESGSFGERGRTTDFSTTAQISEDAVDTVACGKELHLVTGNKQE